MESLESLCSQYGGKFTRQRGAWPRAIRDYWLIFEALHPIAAGYLSRSAQIHKSWGMRWHIENNQMRTLECYSLVLITRGHGWYRDEFTKADIEFQAGDLICLFPGQAHAYAPDPGESWDEINIEFVGPVFDSWMGIGLLDPHQPIRHLAPFDAPDKIDYWLRRFYDVVLPLLKSNTFEPSLSDTGRMLALIAEMCDSWQSGNCDADVKWISDAKRQLRELPFDQKPDYDELARSYSIGEQAYRKKFKRLGGLTPVEYRSRLQIEAACHELISDKPIKEIGYDLGFGSYYYFSRRFKQLTGMTPGEYRNRVNA
ncbi:AraC family transcriptional regulator [Ruficoccus sp. ZRK36]|uniref:AraC family transcriptional regulator n=1 Tax=Ruficoccus sp. ZRK36 TaxID=2866311 RepID=UPI001C7360AC|nr:AraC family transcriptional regulator [Ruficoccus sp. ZRK36]QYY35027.1 AraC family transcriptional regulator [Ruficoccus sp. ZRK36]